MDELQKSSWAEMAPDLLANIFARLSLQHLLVIVPSVCKSWQLASRNSLCYLSLDLRGFSNFRIVHFLQQVIPRSQGGLQHLFISCVRNLYPMYLLARSAPLLRTLHILGSDLDDDWAAYAAPKMPHIVDLNLNLCSNRMSHLAIKEFGKSCRHILKLRRNRPWWQNDPVSDDDALTIAQYYPFIKHLELQSNPLSEKGLKAILLHCPLLEYLDLAGCVQLSFMHSSLLDECHARLKVFWEPTLEPDDEPTLEFVDDSSSDDEPTLDLDDYSSDDGSTSM